MKLEMWFRGLKGRLLVMIAIPTLAMAVILTIMSSGVSKIDEAITEVTAVRMPSIKGLEAMNEGQTGVTYRLYASLTTSNEVQRNQHLDSYELKRKQINEGWKLYEPLPQTVEEAKKWQQLVPAWKAWEQDIDKVVQLVREGNISEARQLLEGPQTESFLISEKLLGEVISINYEIAAEEEKRADETTESSKSLGYVLGFVGVISTLTFGLLFAEKLSRVLIQLVNSVSESGGHVKSASTQLSLSSQQLSAGASEAAASLEETVASLEEMTSIVEQNSNHAQTASEVTLEAKQSVETGAREIGQLSIAMSEISQSSKKIEEIINVIDDIAFQTNLLALNASVEAARAGDQGKGFAVVAEAVRTLAQRSAVAAKEITDLIKTNVSRVENGALLAERSGVALKSISQAVGKVASLNLEIAHASREQSTGIGQISQAMNQLDQVTQQNASSAEEIAASSEETSAQADVLDRQVADLRTIIQGRSA